MTENLKKPETERSVVRNLTWLVLLIVAAVVFGWAISELPTDSGVPSPAPLEQPDSSDG